jgi:hypothetical protein
MQIIFPAIYLYVLLKLGVGVSARVTVPLHKEGPPMHKLPSLCWDVNPCFGSYRISS